MKVKKEIQGHQQAINRLSSAQADYIQQTETAKAESELLANHRDVARESLKYYHEMEKCAKDWTEIEDLASLVVMLRN